MRGAVYAALAAACLFCGSGAAAQTREPDDDEEVEEIELAPPITPGHIADSTVGEAGERQTRFEAAPGVSPTARVASRIQNRVQSRLRTRVDRHFDPSADAASPFEVAEDQVRAGNRPPR